MAVSIDWGTKVINVPRADMQLVQMAPNEIRQLDLNEFRLELKDLEDSTEGMAFERTNKHNTSVAIGGVVLARVIEIVNDYTVTFEDGMYAVTLLGANSNVGDRVNVNQVSIRSANSAGLTNSEVINSLAFTQSSVHVDLHHGRAGTGFPRGTQTDRVNNLNDAFIIAFERKLTAFTIYDSIVLDRDMPEDWTIYGATIETEDIVDFNGFDASGSIFQDCSLIGTMAIPTSHIEVKGGRMGPLTNFCGLVFDCILVDDIDLAPGQCLFTNCKSAAPGTQTVNINCQHNDVTVFFRVFSGVIQFANLSHPDSFISFDLASGKVTLLPSVDLSSGAAVNMRGEGVLINTATGKAMVSVDMIDPTIFRIIYQYVTKKLLRFTQYIGLS